MTGMLRPFGLLALLTALTLSAGATPVVGLQADTQDLFQFGHLLGTKISLNEFVAFADLGHMKQTLTPRTFAIATYALCGFANFASIGIQIGGISAIVMILSTGRAVHAYTNLQTIMTKMRRLDTAFGEYGGARTFGDTSQLLPYGVPLTAGTIGILLTYYFGGWLP